VRERRRRLSTPRANTATAVSGIALHWRGLPSVALSFGEANDCVGWLVGPAHGGLKCMFQMMNEARIMVGVNGAATASVAFQTGPSGPSRCSSTHRPSSARSPVVARWGQEEARRAQTGRRHQDGAPLREGG
jgi:hypothetical protein